MDFLKLLMMVLNCQKGEVDLGGESTDAGDSSDSGEVSSDSVDLDTSSDSSDSLQVQATTESELEAEIEQAIEEGASQEEVKDMIRQFTLKVNGREFVKKIDLNDEEGLKKELQLAAAGRLAMQESAELKKLYSSEIERLRREPTSVLKELGFGEEELVELFANEINQFLDKKKRPKEEIEAEERQKQFEKLKKEKEELENKIKERERMEAMSKLEHELENDIMSALDGDPDLPSDDPEVIAMVADAMLYAYDHMKWTDVKPADVIPTVKKELEQKFRKSVRSLKSPAAIKAMLGEDIFNQLREERIQQAKKIITAKELKKSSGVEAPKSVESAKPKRKISDILRG